MARTRLVAGNWKLHGSRAANRALLDAVLKGLVKGPECAVCVPRSEERRVGKSVDHCVTGVQTCALPICRRQLEVAWQPGGEPRALGCCPEGTREGTGMRGLRSEIGRASCREKCRSLCDWSSDVCSSDLSPATGSCMAAGRRTARSWMLS